MTENQEEPRAIIYSLYCFTIFIGLIFLFGSFPRIPSYYADLSLGIAIKILRILILFQYGLAIGISAGVFLYEYWKRFDINSKKKIKYCWIACETFDFLTVVCISLEFIAIGFIFEIGFNYISGYIIFIQICCFVGIFFLNVFVHLDHREKRKELDKIAQFWNVMRIKINRNLYYANKFHVKEKIQGFLDDLDKKENDLNWSHFSNRIQRLIRDGEQIFSLIQNDIQKQQNEIHSACDRYEVLITSHPTLSKEECARIFEEMTNYSQICHSNHWSFLYLRLDHILSRFILNNPSLNNQIILMRGVKISLIEYSIITEIEAIIGVKIPLVNSRNDFTWGALIENSHVVNLIISHHRFDFLPDSIGDLHFLTVLELSYCDLHEIPTSIGNLSKLVILNLQHNHLLFLPNSIENLTNLEILTVSNNRLIQLPEGIGALRKLFRLRINQNNLELIPVSIIQIPHLESILIKDNPFIFRYPNRIEDLKRFIERLCFLLTCILNEVDKSTELVFNFQYWYFFNRYGAFLREKWKNLDSINGRRLFKMFSKLENEQIQNLGILL